MSEQPTKPNPGNPGIFTRLLTDMRAATRGPTGIHYGMALEVDRLSHYGNGSAESAVTNVRTPGGFGHARYGPDRLTLGAVIAAARAGEWIAEDALRLGVLTIRAAVLAGTPLPLTDKAMAKWATATDARAWADAVGVGLSDPTDAVRKAINARCRKGAKHPGTAWRLLRASHATWATTSAALPVARQAAAKAKAAAAKAEKARVAKPAKATAAKAKATAAKADTAAKVRDTAAKATAKASRVAAAHKVAGLTAPKAAKATPKATDTGPMADGAAMRDVLQRATNGDAVNAAVIVHLVTAVTPRLAATARELGQALVVAATTATPKAKTKTKTKAKATAKVTR